MSQHTHEHFWIHSRCPFTNHWGIFCWVHDASDVFATIKIYFCKCWLFVCVSVGKVWNSIICPKVVCLKVRPNDNDRETKIGNNEQNSKVDVNKRDTISHRTMWMNKKCLSMFLWKIVTLNKNVNIKPFAFHSNVIMGSLFINTTATMDFDSSSFIVCVRSLFVLIKVFLSLSLSFFETLYVPRQHFKQRPIEFLILQTMRKSSNFHFSSTSKWRSNYLNCLKKACNSNQKQRW